jgi:hypothetical protein
VSRRDLGLEYPPRQYTLSRYHPYGSLVTLVLTGGPLTKDSICSYLGKEQFQWKKKEPVGDVLMRHLKDVGRAGRGAQQ